MSARPSATGILRRSMRYAGYDYCADGAYFITICAAHGKSVFGTIEQQEVQTSELGNLLNCCWLEIPTHYSFVRLDEFCIMPNHCHGLLWIDHTSELAENDGSASLLQPPALAVSSREPAARRFGEPVRGSLSVIIGHFKSAVTRLAIKNGLNPERPLWHRNFWDHIVRNERELAMIRDYIRNNPARWAEDKLHPEAPPNQFNQWK